MQTARPCLRLGQHRTTLPIRGTVLETQRSWPIAAMTVQNVAGYLNVDPETVYRMVNRGDLPGFEVGGIRRFQKDDIDGWIEKQKAASAQGKEDGQ